MIHKRFLAIVALFWFSQYVYVPYQAQYLLEAGVLPSFTGMVIGAYGLAQLMLRMPVGAIADRSNYHKPFIITGICAAGLASFIRICFPGGYGFLAANLFSGVASTAWISFTVLYASYYPPQQTRKAMSLMNAANSLGVFFAFTACSTFYSAFGMWFLCLLSVISILPALFLCRHLKEQPLKEVPPTIVQLLTVYRDQRLWLFSILAMVQQGILMSTCMSFTSTIIVAAGGGSTHSGAASVIYIVAAFASAVFAASNLAAKHSPRWWIARVFFLLAAYCILLPNLALPGILIIQVLAGLSTGIIFSYCMAESVKNIPPQKKSTAMGLHQAIYAFGMTVFPLMSGRIIEFVSLAAAFQSSAALAALCGLSILIWDYFHQHKPRFFRNL